MGTDGSTWRWRAVPALVVLAGYACTGNSPRGSTNDSSVNAGGSSNGGSTGGSAGEAGEANSPDGGAGGSNAGTSGTGGSGASASGAGGSGTGGPGTGGSGTGGSGTGGSGASASGTGGSGTGDSGAGGSGGTAPEPVCAPDTALPDDPCVYPESLGSGSLPNECGVTPAAWYPLGASEPLPWPGRAVGAYAEGEGVNRLELPASESRVAVDSDGRVVVTWIDDEGTRVSRWDEAHWNSLDPLPPVEGDTYYTESVLSHDVTLDSSDRLLVAELFGIPEGLVRLSRLEESGWQVLADRWTGIWAPPSGGLLQLAIDDSDRVTVVWDDVDRRPFGFHSVGSDWEDLPENNLLTRARKPAVAHMPDGSPVVAWYSEDTDSTPGSVVVQRVVDGAWEGFGDASTNPAVSEGAIDFSDPLAVAALADGSVIVTWPGAYRVWDGDTWGPIEDSGPLGDAGSLLVTSAEGALYALSEEPAGVSQWLEDAWEPLPDTPLLSGKQPSLAVGPGEQLALSSVTESGAVLVQRYRDDTWLDLREAKPEAGGIAHGDTSQLLINGNGTGVLIVNKRHRSCTILQWDGSSWQPMTLPVWRDRYEFPESCHGAIDRTGRVHLGCQVSTWDDAGGGFDTLIMLREGDGGWERFGSLYSTDSTLDMPQPVAIDFDSGNRPLVASTEGEYREDKSSVHVSRWEGEEWWEFTGGADVAFVAEGDFVHAVRLALTPDDRPLVAKLVGPTEQTARLHVLEWTGDGWSELGSAGLPFDVGTEAATLDSLSLTLDTSGTPVVTWRAGNDLEAFVWSGSSWAHVTATEDLLGTLPESTRWAAWAEEGDVQVGRFEECGWTGLSASNRGGGVSNTVPESLAPSLALNEDRVCVAWSDWVDPYWHVFVRCHD